MRVILCLFLAAYSAAALAVTYPLTVNINGYGYVTVYPSATSCSSSCSIDVEAGTQVTIYPYGTYSSTFAGWSGACSGSSSCTLTMDAPKSVTAGFNAYIDPIYVLLAVSKSGSGSGSVVSETGGIDCGSVCSGMGFNNSSITLRATPDAGSVFAGWSGGGCEGTLTCTVRYGNWVTATFNLGTPTARPVNVSTRGKVQTGFGVMIGGFVINGASQKTVVVRAVGPSLANYGVSGVLANPKLELVRLSDNAVIASNDDWASGPDAAKIRAVGLAPSNPLEAAVYVTIPAGPGAYTAIVTGADGGTGVALVEVYEVDHPEIPIINLSTRGIVEGGFDVMIGGFVILDGPQTVVVRAIGPSLANYGVAGVLANPTMQLVRINDNSVVASNDDWGSASNASQITDKGLAPSNPLESAMLVVLNPGAYTAIVSGVGGATGVALIEIYRIAP